MQTAIRNQREELPRVVNAVDAFARRHRLAPDVVADVQVALDEVLTNIVDYAYTDDAEHEIRIRLEVRDDVLRVSIEDDGVVFNPLQVAEPDTRAPLHERRVGGVGLHFVKHLMIEVSYERIGEYNRLVLTKKLGV